MSISLSSLPGRLTLLALFSATTFYCLYKSRRLRRLQLSLSSSPSPKPSIPKILFLSQTGTSKSLAQRLHRFLASNGVDFELVDARRYEPEDLPKETLLLLVASTWEDGKPPPEYRFFATWLAESAEDFRVGSLLLSRLRFAVFGVGSGAYGDSFNAVARDLAKRMRALGAAEAVPLCEGDVDGGDVDGVFNRWCAEVVGVLKGGDGGVESDGDGGVLSSSEEEEDEEEEDSEVEVEIVDLEDLAGKAPSRKSGPKVEETNGKMNGKKEMVTPVIRANLVKQVQ